MQKEINSANAYSLTGPEIHRAVEIVRRMEESHEKKLGAFGLDDGKGGKEMIDAPMLKQVNMLI
jgi:citrate lyase subunit beta-like protein